METLRKLASQIETRERGSALLVVLMVIVGLSLLGLSFVAMSETEGAISLNQRNYSQAQTVSEAGAKIVGDWFNAPERIASLGLMPPVASETVLKKERWIDQNADGTDENIGRWKVSQPFFCCDKPFKGGGVGNRLWGTYFSPDILIDESTNAGRTFLAAFNTSLFPNPTSGEITEIRIYAPPIVGAVNTPNDINGTVTAGQGYYDFRPQAGQEGVRYGLATIAVKATLKRLPGQLLTATGNRVLSERTTRIVISEWPFPGPQGPVQSNANIQTGGSVVVHWGRMTAQGTMYIKRDLQGLPWMDAHTRIPFWYGGYDTSNPYPAAATNFQRYDIVRPTDPTIAADHNYIASTVVGAGLTSGTEPVWPTGAGATISDGQVTWKERSPARFKIEPGSGAADYPRRPWLFDIIDLPFEDPWVEARARGNFENPGTPAGPQPYPWTWGGGTPQLATAEPNPKLSNWFQYQNRTDNAPSLYKEVVFPRINYTFWKDLALAGQGTEGVFYFRWVSADLFTNGAQTKTFKQWTNTGAGTPRAEPGFYFFDTKNGQNPQVPGGAAFLTPPVNISSAGGNIWTMSGFIYLNAEEFGTQGVNGVDGDFNFPGEPYLDESYREVDTATNRLKRDPISGALLPVVADKVGNRFWDYQDANATNQFDLYLTQRSIKRNTGAVVNNVWMPVQYFDGCTIANNSTCPGGAACCSEPHEPYINLQYPLNACCVGGSYPNTLTVGWQAPNTQTKRPKKKLLPAGTVMPNCNGADAAVWDAMVPPRSLMYCSSNLYDRDGEFDTWSGVQEAPVLNGVFYNEGAMSAQGNARYFGSLLINGSVDNAGTPEVWFDERLIKDEWPPASWPFPRVFVTSTRTDDL